VQPPLKFVRFHAFQSLLFCGVAIAATIVVQIIGAISTLLSMLLGILVGVACLGAVIRGETSHYDHVCEESARGIMDVMLRTGVPCSFGVLTVDTMAQAIARSGGDKRDSGAHAAEAVLALVRLRESVA